MYIESIQITSFASFVGFSLDLRQGLNLIEGANEAGKSTVAEFIRYILYGFSSKADRERYIGFESESAGGSLILCEDNKRYRVERKTVGAKEQVIIYDLDTGASVFAGRIPGEVFFGIPAALFMSTVFVGQTGGSHIQGRTTAEAVDNLLFAADEGMNVKKALKRLDDTRVSLLYKNKKGGRLYELEQALSEAEGRLERAKQEAIRIRQLENKIRLTDVEYEENRLHDLNNQLADFQLLTSRERKTQLASLEQDYRAATDAYETHRKKYTHGGFFPDTPYLERMKECAGEVVRCNEQITVYEKRLDVLNREIEKHQAETQIRLREEEARRSILSGKRSLALALAVISLFVFLGAGAATAFFFLTAKATTGGMAAIAMILGLCGMIGGFILSTRYAGRLREQEGASDSRDEAFRERLAVLSADLTEMRNKKHTYKEALDDLCGRWEVSYSQAAVTEMKRVIEEDRRLESEQERARILYVQMKTDREEHYENEPEDDGREIILPEKFDVRDVDGRRRLAEKLLNDKRRAKHEAELELTHLRAVSEEPSMISEERASLEEEKVRLQARYDAAVLAAEKLSAAAEAMRASVSPRLTKTASERMAAVTDGRYEELGVDAEMQMTFRPFTRDGGRLTREESYMSAGTSDVAYVSLRLALKDLICGEKQPPMFFDESFARMDDKRLANLLRLLHEERSQILLLTSSDRERRLLVREKIPCHIETLS